MPNSSRKNSRASSKSTDKRIVLVGAGRMGMAMARGWLADAGKSQISGVDLIDPSPSEDVKALARKRNVRLNPEPPEVADILVLAVKPQIFPDAVSSIVPWVGAKTLILSVMAGVTLRQLSQSFPQARSVRTMPNTPGAVGKGVTAYTLSDACKPSDAKTVERLLSPLGLVEGPISEDLIDAVTAISGSGPAYAFLLAESMTAAGVKLGLTPEMSKRLAQATVAGAGALLSEPGASADDLRRAVTSPNGVTQAALDVLMKPGGMPDLMRVATEAAARRSEELSRGE